VWVLGAHFWRLTAVRVALGRRQREPCIQETPLVPTSLRRQPRVKQALQQAVRWNLLARNPADAVKPPKVERRRMTVHDTDQTAT
jgi:hypothetical protein